MSRVVSYSIGLALAIVLTLAAFGLVFARILPPYVLISIILTLAMVQLVVQLIFFLHLGRGKDSQWNTVVFVFTFFGILLIVLASVWIMFHLNYNMMPSQMIPYLHEQDGGI
jgi:cytochrome o ubiquinol oxidase operon protein cyoD